MKLKINDIFLAAAFLTFLSFGCSCDREQIFLWHKQIVPGIDYSYLKKFTRAGPLHIHILKIDLKNAKINVRPSLAKNVIGKLERTSSIAKRNNAIAAINGSFFEARKKLHLPIGFMVIDGQVVNKSVLARTSIGITKDKDIVFGIPNIKGSVIDRSNKKSVPIWGVNRPRKNDEVIIYTDEYGGTTRSNKYGKEIIVDGEGSIEAITEGDSKIPKDGFVVSLHGWSREFAAKMNLSDKIGIDYNLADKWKDVAQAITGGPLLVKDGQAVHKASLLIEKIRNTLLSPNSRTAIGTSKKGELIFVVVDKRFPVCTGVTYDDLAEIMKEAGAENAVGLDGGHTSTMYLNGSVINTPLRGSEGLVSNALIVTYDGWTLASAPRKNIVYRLVYRFVYKPPSEELIEALRDGAELTPTAYVPRPEDFGMYALYDIYRRVIKPVIPKSLL
jgi:exopolysaccharide biosynthesis protein